MTREFYEDVIYSLVDVLGKVTKDEELFYLIPDVVNSLVKVVEMGIDKDSMDSPMYKVPYDKRRIPDEKTDSETA